MPIQHYGQVDGDGHGFGNSQLAPVKNIFANNGYPLGSAPGGGMSSGWVKDNRNDGEAAAPAFYQLN